MSGLGMFRRSAPRAPAFYRERCTVDAARLNKAVNRLGTPLSAYPRSELLRRQVDFGRYGLDRVWRCGGRRLNGSVENSQKPQPLPTVRRGKLYNDRWNPCLRGGVRFEALGIDAAVFDERVADEDDDARFALREHALCGFPRHQEGRREVGGDVVLEGRARVSEVGRPCGLEGRGIVDDDVRDASREKSAHISHRGELGFRERYFDARFPLYRIFNGSGLVGGRAGGEEDGGAPGSGEAG